jgi:hypothetical protein
MRLAFVLSTATSFNEPNELTFDTHLERGKPQRTPPPVPNYPFAA